MALEARVISSDVVIGAYKGLLYDRTFIVAEGEWHVGPNAEAQAWKDAKHFYRTYNYMKRS